MSEYNQNAVERLQRLLVEYVRTEGHMKPEERLAAIQQIEVMNAQLQKRPAIHIISKPLPPGHLGGITQDNSTILLASSFFNHPDKRDNDYYSAYELLDTILHEGRHAWQYSITCPPESRKMVDSMHFLRKAYTNKQPDYCLLQNEVDARHYALFTMVEMIQSAQGDISEKLEQDLAKAINYECQIICLMVSMTDDEVEAMIQRAIDRAHHKGLELTRNEAETMFTTALDTRRLIAPLLSLLDLNEGTSYIRLIDMYNLVRVSVLQGQRFDNLESFLDTLLEYDIISPDERVDFLIKDIDQKISQPEKDEKQQDLSRPIQKLQQKMKL